MASEPIDATQEDAEPQEPQQQPEAVQTDSAGEDRLPYYLARKNHHPHTSFDVWKEARVKQLAAEKKKRREEDAADQEEVERLRLSRSQCMRDRRLHWAAEREKQKEQERFTQKMFDAYNAKALEHQKTQEKALRSQNEAAERWKEDVRARSVTSRKMFLRAACAIQPLLFDAGSSSIARFLQQERECLLAKALPANRRGEEAHSQTVVLQGLHLKGLCE